MVELNPNILVQDVERMLNFVPREVLKVIRLSDYLRNLPRDNIHHASPKAFPENAILSESRTSKLDFLTANVVPRQ